MPICTTCAAPVSSLWTVYSSASNIRLTPCDACHTFADPYVEQPPLLLFFDLVLLKPGVYRHLLWNRGVGGVQAGTAKDGIKRVEAGRWAVVRKMVGMLAVGTVLADTYLRWTALPVSQTFNSPVSAFSTLLGSVIFETALFHLTVVICTLVILWIRRRFRSPPQARPPRTTGDVAVGEEEEFHPLLIPLTLLLSSLPKLLLLLLLSIWPTPLPTSTPSPTPHVPFTLPPFLAPLIPLLAPLKSLLSDETLDRSWVVRHVLGGMGVGFGMRVLLMGRMTSLESAGVVCLGWWVGGRGMGGLGFGEGHTGVGG